MKKIKYISILVLFTVLFIASLTQCRVNKMPDETMDLKNCASSDSLYRVLKNMDFKSYQKKDFKYLFDDANFKEYRYKHFVSNNSCLVCLTFSLKYNIYVNIELNSFKKLKRCVKQYSEWHLEDAKEETFDKITIFKSCDTSDFQHFIFTTNPKKVEPK